LSAEPAKSFWLFDGLWISLFFELSPLFYLLEDPMTPYPPAAPLHFKTAFNPKDISALGAKMFGVTVEQFTSWHWQMKNQVQSIDDTFLKSLDLSAEEKSGFEELKDKFQVGVTPYYLALMNPKDPNCPVRKQGLPHQKEGFDALGVEDPLWEVQNSPVKEVVHVYKDRVAFCVAQLCPVYCRYCFRKRRDDEVGLHFNPKIVDAGIEYIASNTNIRDVLITGGDPLIANDATLENLLSRLSAIPHIQVLRIGTRVPVTLPYRITPQLTKMLAQFHPLWINTHFNTADEITPQAAQAVDLLLQQGIPVGNQTVLLAGINDTTEQLKNLFEGLIRIRARPYYIYQAQTVEGTEHLRVPIEKGLDLMRSLRGHTTGFAIPQYVLDTPYGKIPLSPNMILGRNKDGVVLQSHKGPVWTEPNPLGSYESQWPLAQL
jgi:lysine 2,3-aminomutase